MKICSFFTTIYFLISLFTISYCAQADQSLLPCRPINVGINNSNSRWITALIDHQVRFRLYPFSPINETALYKEIPSLFNYRNNVTDRVFFNAAEKLKYTHLFQHKFELLENNKVMYYAEIIESKNKQPITQVERDIPLDNLPSGIDSCLLMILPKFGYTFSTDASRFFSLPVAGSSIKSYKPLGEILYKESDSSISRLDIGKKYERLLKKDPLMLLVNYKVGMLYYKSKKFDKSAKYIKEILDLTPMYSSLYLILARSYRYDKRFNEALSIAQQCERNHLKTIPYLLEKALALEGLKQLNDAFLVYKQILMLNPSETTALTFMARLRNDERNYTKGKMYANKVLKIDRNNVTGYYEMGRSLIGLNKYSEAKRALIYAEQLQPKNPYTQELLGDVLMIQNKPDSAFIHYKRSSSLKPREIELYLKESRALEAAGKKKKALSMLYSITSRFKAKPLLRKEIGLLEFSTGNIDSAIHSLTMYLGVEPNDEIALLTIGKAYLTCKNYTKANYYLNKALPRVNNKTHCSLLIAETELKLNNIEKATEYLNKIIADKPIKGAYMLKADALLLSNDKKGALKSYKMERELHGNDKKIQKQIAQLHYDLKFYAPAKNEFKKLIEISPDDADGLYHLCIIELHEGNTKKGKYYFKKALQAGTGTVNFFNKIAYLFYKNNVPQQAIKAYKEAISLDPNNELSLTGLSDAYIKIKNDTAAAAINIRLFGMNNKKYSSRLAQAGHLYLKHNQEKAATSAFNLFIEKGFSDQEVNCAYARILYNSHNYQKAISLLKNISGDYVLDTNNLLMLSDAYCQTKQYSLALPWLSKLRQITTEIRQEARLSAIANEQCGDTLSAIAMYVRLLKFPPDSQHTDEAYHLGILYKKKNLIENAIARFELNCKESPNDLRSYERLGALYMQRKDWKNAKNILEKAVKRPQVNTAIQKMLAQTYVAVNDMNKATELYSAYLSKVKDDLEAWKELADIYYNSEKYSKAIEPLKQVTILEPQNFAGWYKLGRSLSAIGNFTNAISPLGKARAIKPDDLHAIELMARCYRKVNETTTLKATLREWIALDPKRYDIKLELGSILINEKEIDEAISMLTEAIRFIPSEAKPHLLLAKAYELKTEDSLRYQHLQEALKFNSENWETHYQLTRYYLSKRLGHDAEPHFKKAIALYPSNKQLHKEYGLYLISQKEFDAAAIECQAALDLEPKNPYFLILKAYTECMKGNKSSAQTFVSKAVNNVSSDAQVYYWVGKTYKELEQPSLAKEALSKALSMDSSLALCYETLGDIYMGEVQFKKATRYYFQSWDKGGYNPLRVFKLGNALFYDQKFVEARDFFETILSKNKKFDDARYRLVAAYCELGMLDKAQKQIPLFIENNSHWKYLAQGIIFEKEKNYQAALSAYSNAKSIAPSHPDVFAGLGRVYFQQEQLDSALLYLSTASASDTLNMQAMIDVGTAFEKNDNNTSAVQYYIEVEKKYPQYPDIHARVARIKSKQHAHETAIRYLERGITYHPKDTTLYFLLGREYTYTNQYDKAIEAFKKSLKIGRNKPIEALRCIGDIYYDYLANSKKARDYYKKYIKEGGVQPQASKRLADL